MTATDKESVHGIQDRAVMECFYGPLWDAESRATVMRFAALRGATSYVYGPAADTHTGADWRSPFVGRHAADLAEMVDTAHALGLSVTWRVSPSVPLQRDRAIRFGDPAEQDQLKRHVMEALNLGFDRVLVAFDDVDGRLDPETMTRFGNEPHPLAAAQAFTLNVISEHVKNNGSTLLACPTRYWGTEPSEYRSRFGDLLDPDVPVCWTGPRVVSPAIRGEDAAVVREQYQHDLWLWDNYPVNDWDAAGKLDEHTLQPRRLPLRALSGRESSVAESLIGYGANAALLPWSGLPALATALDWARNPRAYDAETSHLRALASVSSSPAALATLADASGPSAGGDQKSSSLLRAAGRVLSELASVSPEALDDLRQVSAAHVRAALELTSSVDPICVEIRPWAAELARACNAALCAADVLTHLNGTDEGALDRAIAALRNVPTASHDVTLATGAIDVLVGYVRGAAGVGLGSLTEDV